MSAPLKAPDPKHPLNTLREVLAFNVCSLRAALGVSQEQLAVAAGVDRTFVSQIKRGRVDLSLDNIEKLSSALEVPADHLLMHPNQGARRVDQGTMTDRGCRKIN